MNAPEPINRYSRTVQLALQPLPVLPSMLRERRECRIELHKLTVEIGQRYAREAAAGQGFN
ncbi:MAG: hypothetical protein ACK5QX_11005 [bacterium]|jgi:hypothetical protein